MHVGSHTPQNFTTPHDTPHHPPRFTRNFGTQVIIASSKTSQISTAQTIRTALFPNKQKRLISKRWRRRSERKIRKNQAVWLRTVVRSVIIRAVYVCREIRDVRFQRRKSTHSNTITRSSAIVRRPRPPDVRSSPHTTRNVIALVYEFPPVPKCADRPLSGKDTSVSTAPRKLNRQSLSSHNTYCT